MQEVGGSIPPGSTSFYVGDRSIFRPASPSSRGLGHIPFTDATGVRIPVGTPFLNAAKLIHLVEFDPGAHGGGVCDQRGRGAETRGDIGFDAPPMRPRPVETNSRAAQGSGVLAGFPGELVDRQLGAIEKRVRLPVPLPRGAQIVTPFDRLQIPGVGG